ncbi:replication initiation protein [Vibrio sp. OPT20]|uniref:replication initiation protein n=1 Tax=Vibrio sp. OPT20 TaxID=2778642 RepID=UPI00187E727C|nr:replication initiation protein [Vibrio sp. OPT20]MBE8564189.1 replication initiation protein [Vibrio sp. OPT20]
MAAFAPTSKVMIANINEFVAGIEADLIALEDTKKVSERLKASNDLPRITNNIKFEGEVGSEERKVIWSATAALECTHMFFANNAQYRIFNFDARDFINYWTPGLLAREGAKMSAITKAMNKSLKKLSGAIYEAYLTENGEEVHRHIPVFGEIAVTSKAVQVRLNSAFMPYLVFYSRELLKLGFTQLPIYFVRHATSEHTMKLLMALLRRINLKGAVGVREITIDMDEFRDEMGVKEQYKKRLDLSRYVIDKAVSDILAITANVDATNKAIDDGTAELDARKKASFKLLKVSGNSDEPNKYYEFNERGRKTYSITFKVDPTELVTKKRETANSNDGWKVAHEDALKAETKLPKSAKKKKKNDKLRNPPPVVLHDFLANPSALGVFDSDYDSVEPGLTELLGVKELIGKGGGKYEILNAVKDSKPF